MSDPVTNAQIEDVLSSIRRLVSEDTRQNLRSARPERPASRPASAQDKLVLTPALRIAEPVDDDLSEPVDDDLSEAAEQSAAEAAFQPAVDPAASDDFDTAGFDVAEDASSEGFAFEAEEAEFTEEDGFEIEAELEIDLEPDTEFGTEAEVEAVVEDVEEAPWRDPDATLFEAAGVTPLEDHAEPAAQVVEDVEVSLEEQPDVLDEALSRKVAALEKMIAGRDDNWEPDGVQEDDYSGTEVEAMTWEDVAPEGDDFHETPSTGFRAVPEVDATDTYEDDEDDGPLDLLSGDDPVIDEAALRELVADIVREELQGALGERITRNVRKLVRREIHRALSIQDLE